MKRVALFFFAFGLGVGLAASSPVPQQDKVQASIGAGDGYLRFKDYSNAIACFTDAIQADPRSVQAYLKRAWAYLEWGGKANEDKALADAVKAIELEPANASAHHARGKVYFRRATSAKDAKNLKEAHDLFGKALADYEVTRVEYPDWILLLVDIGHAYFARGDLDRALAAYSRAYEKAPSYGLGVDKALETLFAEYGRQKRGFSCGNAPRTWHLAGYFYWSHSHPDLAIQCFSRALDLGHDPFDVYYFRSNAYAAQGDFVSAIADADNAVKLRPSQGSYENRAEIYEKKGDLDKAISDYTEAIKRQKKYAKSMVSAQEYNYQLLDLYNLYLRRGNVYVKKESWDKAIADFMTVERRFLPGPQKAGLYRKIAAVYELKGDARNAARYRQKAQDEDRGVKK